MMLLVQVAKIPLSLLVAISGLFGSLLFGNWEPGSLLLSTTGIFLLAISAASLNNLQDRILDRRFSRTQNRALARNLIGWRPVLTQTFFCALAGTVFLSLGSQSYIAPAIGLIALLLYNGLYTPLKPVTIWALLPGTLSGMLPPYIGWLAVGGDPSSIQILLVMALLGIWQIPHYWLLLLEHRQEFIQNRSIYSITTRYSEKQLKRIIFTWVLAYACLSYCLPLVGIATQSNLSWILIITNGIVLAGSFLRLLLPQNNRPFKALFHHLNLSLLVVMLIAGTDTFL